MRRITLEALGLSPKEHAVLNVLQQRPMAQKISKISREVELPQSTTSFILRKLEKRKLAERISHENHFRWKYRKNLDIYEQYEREGKSEGAPIVLHGMTSIVKELTKLLELSSSERFLSIQGSDISKSILKKLDDKFLASFHAQIKKRSIIIDGVISESVFRLFEKMPLGQLSSHLGRLSVAYVLPDELVSFPLDTFIFRDTVLFVDYETEFLTRIDNSSIAKILRSFFALAQQQGRKIDLNKHLETFIVKTDAAR